MGYGEDPFEKEAFDYYTDLESMEEDRLQMYGPGLGEYPLRSLALLWAQELSQVGLSEVDATSSSVPKRGEKAYDPKLEKLGGDLYPVRLDESQRIVWINLEGDRAPKGYISIEVLDKPLLTDTAIIAALTALEGSGVQPLSVLPEPVRIRLKAPIEDASGSINLREVLEDLKGEFSPERDLKLSLSLEPLSYPLALLRERRPGFDELPYEEQYALLEGTCDRIHEFSQALRKLVSFLEFGAFDPGKGKAVLPKRTMQNAQRYITAAVLRDVEGSLHRDIAAQLDVPIPPTYSEKKDIPAVRELYEKGRDILKRALGEGGWEKQVEAMKTEIEWWDSLNPDQQEAARLLGNTLPLTEGAAQHFPRQSGEDYKALVENVKRIEINGEYVLVQGKP